MKPFDYLNDINFDKQNIIEESDNPELAEKLYPPFLVNKGLSQFIDTVRIANEINLRHYTDKKLQFDFLLNTIRKKKRFTKWAKKDSDDRLDIVMKHYGYSYEKAKQVIHLLTDEHITIIRKQYYEGGLNDGRSGQND